MSASQTQYEKPGAQPIVLIGLMGAGKTTIGKRLATALKWPFVDMDDEIVTAAGCSINDIFAVHGEMAFRDLEARVAKRLLLDDANKKRVIATGGGAWMQDGVRALIKQHAVSIWLKAPLEVLHKRVANSTARPLLEEGDKLEILQGLIHQRYPSYAQADITVDSGQGAHQKVVDNIMQALAARAITS